jgi:hypothetical protein
MFSVGFNPDSSRVDITAVFKKNSTRQTRKTFRPVAFAAGLKVAFPLSVWTTNRVAEFVATGGGGSESQLHHKNAGAFHRRF